MGSPSPAGRKSSSGSTIAKSVVKIETIGGLEVVGKLLVGTGPTTGLAVGEDGFVISSAFNFVQQPSSILVTLSRTQTAGWTICARHWQTTRTAHRHEGQWASGPIKSG